MEYIAASRYTAKPHWDFEPDGDVAFSEVFIRSAVEKSNPG